jgi:hypothetical protein
MTALAEAAALRMNAFSATNGRFRRVYKRLNFVPISLTRPRPCVDLQRNLKNELIIVACIHVPGLKRGGKRSARQRVVELAPWRGVDHVPNLLVVRVLKRRSFVNHMQRIGDRTAGEADRRSGEKDLK